MAFLQNISGVRLYWKLEEAKGPEGGSTKGYVPLGSTKEQRGHLAHKEEVHTPRTLQEYLPQKNAPPPSSL